MMLMVIGHPDDELYDNQDQASSRSGPFAQGTPRPNTLLLLYFDDEQYDDPDSHPDDELYDNHDQASNRSGPYAQGTPPPSKF